MSWDARSGHVRLVSRVTDSLRSGSIHKDVPVKPRCPNAVGEKNRPEDDSGRERVSQPSARVVPSVEDSRWVNSFTVSCLRIGDPPRNMHSAKRDRSVADAKTPACPATPAITYAFSSLTSP